MTTLSHCTRFPILRNRIPRVIAMLIVMSLAREGGILPAVANSTPPAEVTISGTILYTGRSSAGGGSDASFPVRNAVVEVWDRNASGADVRVATGHTFDDGSYSLIVPTAETQPGLRASSIRMCAWLPKVPTADRRSSTSWAASIASTAR